MTPAMRSHIKAVCVTLATLVSVILVGLFPAQALALAALAVVAGIFGAVYGLAFEHFFYKERNK
jgi:energy-converting hydrogenase Eha subunit A